MRKTQSEYFVPGEWAKFRNTSSIQWKKWCSNLFPSMKSKVQMETNIYRFKRRWFKCIDSFVIWSLWVLVSVWKIKIVAFFSSLDSLALWKKMVVRSGSNRSIPTGNQFCINKPLCVYTVFGLCALLRVSFTANEVCCCCRCRSFVLFLSLLVGLLLIYFVRIETIISFAPERLSPRSKRFLLPFIVHCHFFPLVFVLLSANSKHVSESNCFPMINILALTTRTRTRKSRKENSLFRKKKKWKSNRTATTIPVCYFATDLKIHNSLTQTLTIVDLLFLSLIHSLARLFIHLFSPFFTYTTFRQQWRLSAYFSKCRKLNRHTTIAMCLLFK